MPGILLLVPGHWRWKAEATSWQMMKSLSVGRQTHQMKAELCQHIPMSVPDDNALPPLLIVDQFNAVKSVNRPNNGYELPLSIVSRLTSHTN